MVIDRLDASGLAALEAALRRGESVRLTAAESPTPWDEIVPLCESGARADLADLLPRRPCARPDLAVTVVIPTHRSRPIGLARYARQDVRVTPLVLANGAYTDGMRVAWEGHGATRNRALTHVLDPYVLFTVDDAIPLGDSFLQTLIERLEATGADAVTARQIPWPTADAATRARIRAWTPPTPVAKPPLDNVAALYRTSALRDDPFDRVPIAEDWLWGQRHRIAYAPDAAVVHSHARHFRDLYIRTRDVHRVRIGAGEPPNVPSFSAFLRALPSTVGADLSGALAELLGQYTAARNES